MNSWDNIKAAQIVHDLIHQKRSSESITDFNPSCIYCAGITNQGLGTTEIF